MVAAASMVPSGSDFSEHSRSPLKLLGLITWLSHLRSAAIRISEAVPEGTNLLTDDAPPALRVLACASLLHRLSAEHWRLFEQWEREQRMLVEQTSSAQYAIKILQDLKNELSTPKRLKKKRAQKEAQYRLLFKHKPDETLRVAEVSLEEFKKGEIHRKKILEMINMTCKSLLTKIVEDSRQVSSEVRVPLLEFIDAIDLSPGESVGPLEIDESLQGQVSTEIHRLLEQALQRRSRVEAQHERNIQKRDEEARKHERAKRSDGINRAIAQVSVVIIVGGFLVVAMRTTVTPLSEKKFEIPLDSRIIAGPYTEVPLMGEGFKLFKQHEMWTLRFEPEIAVRYRDRINGIKIYKARNSRRSGLIYEVGAKDQVPLSRENLKGCMLAIYYSSPEEDKVTLLRLGIPK